ncbi:hypothetical protein AKJ09_07347 [Labilithrix luteola]|uniref:Uncharacterized protein n=1 Tax=Labilithrix luteola TaxID=1391654 RepID=A0A0K1Q4L5_9BACT|nr:hypothetical protein AKJ09_07347 [Labilithrix luteola]
MLAIACGDDAAQPAASSKTATGQTLCDSYYAKCPRPDGAGNAGVYECKADQFDTATNKSEVQSCLDGTNACANAQACLTVAKF